MLVCENNIIQVEKTAPSLGNPGKVGLTVTLVEGGEDSIWKECQVCVQGGLGSHTSVAIGQAGPGSSPLVS